LLDAVAGLSLPNETAFALYNAGAVGVANGADFAAMVAALA
jgi:hypothetical protein